MGARFVQHIYMKLDVIFRSCSRVLAVHGNRRVVNAAKEEIILRCLNSLIRAMHEACNLEASELSLTVFDDHSSLTCVETMKILLQSCSFPTCFVALTETGNGPSLKATYEFARENCTGLIYFVEDDYLHAREAVRDLLASHQQISFFVKQDVVLFPCDYPGLYQTYNTTAVVLSENRYWRAIGHTTATILLSHQTLCKHWQRYMDLTGYQPGGEITEANTINLVYREVPCFSPMPSLTVHLGGAEAISPLVNWTEWWEQNALPRAAHHDICHPLIPLAPALADERGEILPLVDEPMKSAMLIRSRKGSIRANHYHRADWHYCYVLSGSLDYYFRPMGQRERPLHMRVEAGQMFFTPPLVEHAMVFCEDTELVCLAKNARDQASYEADITRVQVYPFA